MVTKKGIIWKKKLIQKNACFFVGFGARTSMCLKIERL